MTEEKKKAPKKKAPKKSNFDQCVELIQDLNRAELKTLEGLIKDIHRSK